MRSASRSRRSTTNQSEREPRGAEELGDDHVRQTPASGSRHSKSRRTATLYDTVAGRVGVNGFLKAGDQAHHRASAPEEVLLRRVNAPDEIPYDYYNSDERLNAESQRLPDSELLKDLHSYVADYYERAHAGDEKVDFRSFDETALLAMGILLEEACKEALGENGDMVFTEPAHHDRQLPRDRDSRHQVIGQVIPPHVSEYQTSSEEELDATDVQPRKRQRRRYQSSGDY